MPVGWLFIESESEGIDGAFFFLLAEPDDEEPHSA
jgi:hypothetical protein